jgi:hypothetical protein
MSAHAPLRRFLDIPGSAKLVVRSAAFETARCGQLPRIALLLAIQDGPCRAARLVSRRIRRS